MTNVKTVWSQMAKKIWSFLNIQTGETGKCLISYTIQHGNEEEYRRMVHVDGMVIWDLIESALEKRFQRVISVYEDSG